MGLLGSTTGSQRAGVAVIVCSLSSGMAIDGMSGSVRLMRSASAWR
jgi:hypothetical protein